MNISNKRNLHLLSQLIVLSLLGCGSGESTSVSVGGGIGTPGTGTPGTGTPGTGTPGTGTPGTGTPGTGTPGTGTPGTGTPGTGTPIPAANTPRRIAIVYSGSTAPFFWDAKAYSQLFMSAQMQAMQAGIPFDLLSENDLTDLSKIINYNTLVFPYFANVDSSKLTTIESNLRVASRNYRVGLIAAGNFMTNDQNGTPLPGNSYSRMESLLGVTRISGGLYNSATLTASNSGHPMFQGSYANNELVLSYSNAFVDYFGGTNSADFTVTPLLNQTIDGSTHSAVISTTNASGGARNIHFSTLQYMTDANLLWPAIQWSTYAQKSPVSLKLGRETSLFASRIDMDKSMFPAEVVGVGESILSLVTQWKNTYNFLGSYYVNIGNQPTSDDRQMTDWAVSAPLYRKYLAFGSEIGSHSLTHPFDTNILTSAQIEYEFDDSAREIGAQLGLSNLGGAVPGAPDKMPAAVEMLKHVSYLSGGYSGVGAGFPNAMGYLTPSDTKVYLSPNITFDYTQIEFLKKTPAQTEAAWINEFNHLNKHANQAVIHWPWHDYGPTVGTAVNYSGTRPDGSSINYTQGMYTSLIDTAFKAGTEFVTGADLSSRIASFRSSTLSFGQPDASTISIALGSANAGRFALAIAGGQPIASVDNWYAYNKEKVFPAANGGSYTVRLGATPAAVNHISKLPMRANLLSVSAPNLNQLDFSFEGEGLLEVTLRCAATQRQISGGNEVGFNPATKVLTISFPTLQRNTATVKTNC